MNVLSQNMNVHFYRSPNVIPSAIITKNGLNTTTPPPPPSRGRSRRARVTNVDEIDLIIIIVINIVLAL